MHFREQWQPFNLSGTEGDKLTAVFEPPAACNSLIFLQDVPGVLPNISCHTLNFSELVRPEQQHLTAHQLSSFHSRIADVLTLTPELSSQLKAIRQSMQDAEKLWTGMTVSQTYSPLSFKDLDAYVYTKCLLELVDKWLGKAKFWFHWFVGC